jgi:superfamily II DNA or RNA helicase
MSLRDHRQKEFAAVFLNRRKQTTLFQEQTYSIGGILYLCPRFGKCRVGIHIFNGAHEPKILIAYPNTVIKESWLKEFEIMGYDNSLVDFTTHRSLHKYIGQEYDLIVYDEIHLLSDKQIEAAKLIKGTRLGLTGSMTKWTQNKLKKRLGLSILAEYSMEKAIAEGVVTDYEIRVVKCKLDKENKVELGRKIRTEKGHFDAYSHVIEEIEKYNEEHPAEEQKSSKFLRLLRSRIIQSSLGKRNKTIELIQQFKGERLLVFCGSIDVADSLGIPSYHSKSTEKHLFDAFASGEGDSIAIIKIGGTGQTYKPLSKVVVNFFDSNAENMVQKINRCMAMEYDNPEKKAIIYVVSTDEEVELRWLHNALSFFDKNKIKYV